ncbi:MAG: hypothetical protein K9K82_07095 [Desulfobacteraceae bacterium]|nr:hypothetical protein [Desulfobacteraceae bacterium]
MRDPSPFLANPRILKTIHACPSIRATDDLFETALSHIPDFFQVRQAESFLYNSHHNFICLFNARSHRFCGAKEPPVSQRVLGTPYAYLEKIRSTGQDLAGTPHLIGEHLTPRITLEMQLFVLMVPKNQLIKVLDIWSDCARGSSRERMRLLS